jgi:hypothetical protein
MKLSRRSLLTSALAMSGAKWLLNYGALAAPNAGQVKITKIKTMGLDNLGDGCQIRIETDAGSSAMAKPVFLRLPPGRASE